MNFRWIMVAAVLLAGCAHFEPRPISPADNAGRLESRSLENPEFKSFLETNLQRRFDDWPLKSWDFETLTLAAFYYHPSLDVARAQWQVAAGGNKTAAQRPNPTLSAIPGYNFSAANAVSPWIPAISVDIPIETAGKRGYRKAQAQNLSEAARLNIAVTAWQVRGNLRSSLLDEAAARRRKELLQQQNTIQERVVQSLEQKSDAGAISSFELSLGQAALARNRLDLAEARRQEADARVRVADAVGIPVKALEGVELSYDLSARPPAESETMYEQARREALQHRADILGALAEYAASQSALQLEIAKQYPDIHIGPGYQYDQGEDKFTLALTAEIPLLSQNQGPIAEAEGRRAEAAARFNSLQAKVITEIDRAVASCRVNGENLSALELLAAARAKQSQNMAAQVKAGAAAQFDLLNSQIELSVSELAQLDGWLRLQQSLAALEDALQRPIELMKPALIEQPPRDRQARKDQKP